MTYSLQSTIRQLGTSAQVESFERRHVRDMIETAISQQRASPESKVFKFGETFQVLHALCRDDRVLKKKLGQLS